MTAYGQYVTWQLLAMAYSGLVFIFVLYPLTRGLRWSLFKRAFAAFVIGGCLAYVTLFEFEQSHEARRRH